MFFKSLLYQKNFELKLQLLLTRIQQYKFPNKINTYLVTYNLFLSGNFIAKKSVLLWSSSSQSGHTKQLKKFLAWMYPTQGEWNNFLQHWHETFSMPLQLEFNVQKQEVFKPGTFTKKTQLTFINCLNSIDEMIWNKFNRKLNWMHSAIKYVLQEVIPSSTSMGCCTWSMFILFMISLKHFLMFSGDSKNEVLLLIITFILSLLQSLKYLKVGVRRISVIILLIRHQQCIDS